MTRDLNTGCQKEI